MLDKNFSNLSLEDIKILKEDQVSEGKNIDYKEDLNLKGKDSKKEFLADITSFANTDGGHLIIGISEEKGIIEEIVGIEINNTDSFLQQIENLIRDQVNPRIMGLQLKTYDLQTSRKVVHIYIPRSYNGPHMAYGKFFGRNSVGKYPLDYIEIRSKFLQQSGLGQKITEYHLDRVMKVKSNDGYLTLIEGATILINIIPFKALTLDYELIDLGKPESKNLWPLLGGYDFHIGFHGIGGYHSNTQEGVNSYHHISHIGITELADKLLLKPLTEKHKRHIYIKGIEDKLIEAFQRIPKNYRELEIEGPYALCFSMLDINGYTIGYSDRSIKVVNDRDLIFPSIIFDNFDNIETTIQPIIKLLCNAAGIPEKPANKQLNF